MKGYNSYFLRDLLREDVVAAFKNSNVFIFPSKKEVSPLVILESQAAELPWVSMNVGDVEGRKGGIIIQADKVDLKGYKIITPSIIDKYVESIVSIIKDRELKNKLVGEGKEDIKEYDWNNIYQAYDRVFKL